MNSQMRWLLEWESSPNGAGWHKSSRETSTYDDVIEQAVQLREWETTGQERLRNIKLYKLEIRSQEVAF